MRAAKNFIQRCVEVMERNAKRNGLPFTQPSGDFLLVHESHPARSLVYFLDGEGGFTRFSVSDARVVRLNDPTKLPLSRFLSTKVAESNIQTNMCPVPKVGRADSQADAKSITSGRYAVVRTPGRGWSVLIERETQALIKGVPYTLACAVARYLNGQDPEAEDAMTLVEFTINCCRGLS